MKFPEFSELRKDASGKYHIATDEFDRTRAVGETDSAYEKRIDSINWAEFNKRAEESKKNDYANAIDYAKSQGSDRKTYTVDEAIKVSTNATKNLTDDQRSLIREYNNLPSYNRQYKKDDIKNSFIESGMDEEEFLKLAQYQGYLDDIEETNSMKEKISSDIKDNDKAWLNALKFKAVDAVSSLAGGVAAVGETINKKTNQYADEKMPINTYSDAYKILNYNDAAKEAVNEQIKSNFYDTAKTLGFSDSVADKASFLAGKSDEIVNIIAENLLPARAFGYLVNGALGATKLSESLVKQLVTSQFFALGFSEGIKESEERGLDESETLKTATVNGFAEYIGEQIGFDSMNKIIFGEVTEGTAKAIIKSAADDAEGEILTDVINDFGDLFINSDKSKLAQSVYDYEEDGNSHNKALALTLRDTLLSYAETGVTSLIATGVGAGIQSGITHMAENRSNKRAGNYAASNPEAVLNMLSDDRSSYRTDAEFEQAQNAILNSIDASGETLSKSEIKDLGSQVREAYQSQERAKLDAVRNATTPYEMKKASEILNSDSDEANRAKLYAKKRLLDAGFTADDIEKTHTAASLYNAAASGEEISDDIINSFPVEDREEALKALESGRKINTLKTKEGAAIDATNSEAVVVDFTKAVTKENGNILVYDSNGNTHATNTLESVGLTGYALKLATSLNDETAVNNLFNYLSKNSAVSKKALLNNVKKIVSAARMDLSFEAFDKKYSKVFNTKDAKELFDSIENISKDTFKRTNEAKKGKGKVNKERLTTSEGKAAYESMTKGSKNLLNLMAIKLKVDFELFYDESETRGEYIPEEGKITINLKYNRDILSVAMHEGIGEFLQAHAGDKYDVVARHVLEYFYNKSEDALKTTIDAYLKAYIEDGQLDYNVRAAANEFVNDKLGEIFSTEEGINNFIAWLKTADEFKVTANTFRQYFEDLKSWIKEVAASTINHSTLNFNKAEKEADKLSKMFLDAMDEAIKNRDLASDSLEKLQNANIEIDEESGTISKSLNVTIKESYKDLKYDSYDEAINDIAESISKNVKGVTKTQAKKWLLDQESQAASMFLNDEFLYYTNFEFDENYKAIKSDADYKQGTADFSNLCRKRELFTKLFDNLQFSHPDFIFSADDIAEIRNIMTESDLEVACALCYVEDRRQKTGEIAQNFIDEYKNALNSKDKQIRWNNSSGKRKILSNKTVAKKYKVSDFNFKANDSYVPNQADLTTYKGFAELRKNHKEIAAAFQAFNNARGMSAARLIEGHAEYKREILKYSDKRVKMINNLGGLRIFSFSDFESIHLIDLVQVITDCSAKGIKIQAYTKVPAFAKLIANTSVKLNRSLIPATASSKNAYARIKNASGGYEFINVTSDDRGIADINGVEYLAFDTVEGIDVNSKYFEDTSNNPDVGNILIGINDHQTRLAMVDPFIDYIIGFHSNQASSTLEKKGISHWSNYKKQVDKDGNEYFQEETYLPDHKKSQKNRINIYTDVLKKHKVTNKVDFVNAFLDECKKNSLKPRFSQFLDKDADGNYIYTEGYHKLLLDFKLFDMDGNILPQKVVKPDFDVALMNEILLEDAKKERDLSFPKEILDKVENRVINKPRKSLDVKPNAPVFYSKLINEIDAMKQDKISAASVVSFLKGKGVKDDEIKWSGIETFLEGKKSVSKEELLAFAKENELSLEEKILTDSIQDKVNELTNMLDELEASYSLDDWIEPMDESFNNFRFQIDMQDLFNDGEISESDYDKLIKMGNSLLAAENGYDYIGWTTGKMQEDRWSSDFSEGYRIEYDQNIPKFMNKYVKKWGAKVEETSLGIYESYEDGNRVYSVRITPEMKESVLKKGQPRFSLNVDTEGNKLTSDQIDYFKDSKAVDSNGNLLVLYHGTNAEFYEFDYKFAGKNGRQEGFGIYTTDDPEVAAVYGNAKKLYANIKKPFSGLTITLNKSDIKKLVKLGADFNAKRWGEDLKDGWLSNYEDTYSTPISTVIDKVADNYFRYNETDNDIIQGMIHDMSIYDDPEIVHEFYNQVTNALGYDGIITEWENRDGGKNAKIVIAFDSNQLKEVTNEHPTKNPDIRKSLNVDSEYLELAKEPKKNASKLKKMVEDAAKAAGYNVHAYHGTMADYFTVFDTYEVDSNMGSHFGSKEIAEGFASDMYGHGNNRGRVLEVFLKANNPYKTYDWFAQDDFYPAKEAKNLADKIGTKEAYKIVDEIKALSPEIAAAMEDIDELEEGYLDSDEERKVLYGGLRKLLKLAGYDSILYENGLEIVGEWDYIIQDANQIKLADPVTYDDNGNIIPLSERFDSNNNDIRKSLNVLSDDSPFKEAYKKMDAAEALVKKLKIHVVEGKKLKKENLDKLKFALIGKYNLSFDVAFVNELTDDLKKFDSYMRSEDISYDVMMDYAMQIADEIREKSHFFVGGSNLDNDLVIAFELIDNYFSAVKKQNQPKVDPKTQSDLKDTIEEYKKNLEKQYKERVIDIAQKYEEALKRERGTQNLSKSDKQKVKEMAQTKAKEQFNSMKEAEQKAKDKEAIIRTCTRLINWMNAPTDQKHVPIFLKEPLVDVIASINFMPQSLVKDMNATTKAALRWTSSMNKLKDVIQAIKNASDPSLDYKEVEKAQMYSLSLVMEAENLFTEMSKFIDEHNGVANLSDLDAKAMHELARFLNTISHAVNKMNSTFMNTRFESIDDLGKATIKEMNDLKPVFNETSNPMKPMMHEFLNVAMLEPISFFEEFGEASSTIMQEFFDGEKIGIEIIREAENFFTDLSDRLLITQKDTKNWSKELHTFKVEGKDITLSTSDIMSLYASNEQERRAQEKDPTTATYHIMAGGIKTKPKKVNFNKTINYNPQVYHPAKSDLNTIFEVLSDTQKEYIDAVVSYMSNTLSRHGNETSNILYGYDKFTADYYYPLKTDTDTIATNEGNAQTAQVAMRALINPSFTKTRLNKADNALVVYDFFDVVTDHIKGMANYCAYSQAVSDALRWYNYAPTTRTNLENQDDWRRDTFTVKAAMVSVKGTKSKEYFETLLRDINLDNNVKGSAFQDKLIGMVKAQAVTANVRVVLSQPTSITRALKYLGHDNIAKGFSYVLAHPVEAVKYAQDTNYLCYWKSKGFSDYRIAQGMKEIILGSDNRVQGLVEKLGVPAGVADDITWAAMYKASEYKIKKDKPNLDEADYRKAVDNLFSDIINHTQVIDSTLRKTQENRNKSALVKMANAFMNEPQKSYNMLHRAYFNYVQANDMQKANAKKELKDQIAIFAYNALVVAAVQAVIDALRDDSDDKFFDKFLKMLFPVEAIDTIKSAIEDGTFNGWTLLEIYGQMGNFVDNLNPLNMLPYFSEISNIAKGYDSTRMDTQLFTQVGETLEKLRSESTTTYGKLYSIAKTLSMATSIPFANILREIKVINNNFVYKLTDKKWYQSKTSETKAIKAKEERELSEVIDTNDLSKTKEYINSLFDSYISQGLDESESYSKIRDRLKVQYQNRLGKEDEATLDNRFRVLLKQTKYKNASKNSYSPMSDKKINETLKKWKEK